MAITPWSIASGENPLERAEQKALFMWANMARLRGFDAADDEMNYGRSLIHIKGTGVTFLDTLFAVPNGSELAKGARGGADMKAQGMRPGVPDIFLAFPAKGYCGLFIEMKRKLGREKDISEEQHKWISNLQKAGYYVHVAFGWRSAAMAIRGYLS